MPAGMPFEAQDKPALPRPAIALLAWLVAGLGRRGPAPLQRFQMFLPSAPLSVLQIHFSLVGAHLSGAAGGTLLRLRQSRILL